MNPTLEELKTFVNDRKAAAKHFNVSEKTITRWMQHHGLYTPKKNYGVKLNMSLAQEIRQKHLKGLKMKDLAKDYGVTFSAISRIIDNISYPEIKETAVIKVVYNPN